MLMLSRVIRPINHGIIFGRGGFCEFFECWEFFCIDDLSLFLSDKIKYHEIHSNSLVPYVSIQ